MPPGMGMGPPAAQAPDPYASLRPAPGQQFDLRPVDDGIPVENVRQKGGRGGMVVTGVLVLIGLVAGYALGAAAIARRAYNNANAAAKTVKAELDGIQKNVSAVRDAVALSQQRTKELLAFDPKLVEDLAKLDLKNKPSTTRIFKVDYYRLPDLVVDNLMSYYYDALALYGQVDAHVRQTTADKDVLEAFTAKSAEKAKEGGQANYGVVFDRNGPLAIANLVEVGSPVCKGGGSDCGAKDIEGFQIRAATGAPWTTRKIAPMPEGNSVVPIKPTGLFDAVMTGSPEQVRMEAYKLRYLAIQQTIKRLEQVQKELVEAVDKAASRPDLATL